MKKINITLTLISGLSSLVAIILVLIYKTPIPDEKNSLLVMYGTMGGYLSLLAIFAIFFKAKYLLYFLNIFAEIFIIIFINTFLELSDILKIEEELINFMLIFVCSLTISCKSLEIIITALNLIKNIFRTKAVSF